MWWQRLSGLSKSVEYVVKIKLTGGYDSLWWYNIFSMFNKDFYKFLISFVAVIAATLFFILVVGVGAK